jgi:two-component system phosphate regulon sensor histidine kinase PhoR
MPENRPRELRLANRFLERQYIGIMNDSASWKRDIESQVADKEAREAVEDMKETMDPTTIYDAVIQNLPIGFSIIDKNGIIVDFNPAAAVITGYSRDEVIGKPHFEILHGTSDRDACPVLKHALSRKEQTIAAEATIRKKKGEHIVLSVTTFPLSDDNGDLSGAVELFRDISDIKRRERERKNILSMFAHDMKNPITTSGGFLSRLLSGKAGELTEKQKSHLATIREELYKVSDLLADFLEFSRIEAKAYVPIPRPFDIEKDLRRNIEAAKIEADKKGIAVLLEVSGAIPTSIFSDPSMIGRAIANLLDNAIAYTATGGTISVGLSETDSAIRVSIADTGRGIPEDKLPYIFDAFYRISRDSKGSGLGLFIVKTIIEAHGGTIECRKHARERQHIQFSMPKNG